MFNSMYFPLMKTLLQSVSAPAPLSWLESIVTPPLKKFANRHGKSNIALCAVKMYHSGSFRLTEGDFQATRPGILCVTVVLFVHVCVVVAVVMSEREVFERRARIKRRKMLSAPARLSPQQEETIQELLCGHRRTFDLTFYRFSDFRV